jgi:hypothetical protein
MISKATLRQEALKNEDITIEKDHLYWNTKIKKVPFVDIQIKG